MQVIEKAYKKLRLDAMVIQQGRLTDNPKTVGKDDLLSMVRYGAEMVFSSEVGALLHVLVLVLELHPTCSPHDRILAWHLLQALSSCCQGAPDAQPYQASTGLTDLLHLCLACDVGMCQFGWFCLLMTLRHAMARL